MARTLLSAGLAVVAFATGAPPAQADPASEAESLVRETWYEGLPADAARSLGDAGVARLAELLADAGESEHHGNVVLALGLSGHPAAFDALARYANTPPAGEVDRGAFRARTRLGPAMGHLCHDDPRALAWLLREAAKPRSTPGWSFRHHRGDALATLLEEQLLQGLAMSGAAEAQDRLQQARARAAGGDTAALRRRRSLDAGLALHARVAREGAAAQRPPRPGQAR